MEPEIEEGNKIIEEATKIDVENVRWKSKEKGYIKMIDMPEAYLRHVHFKMSVNEAEAFNRANIFGRLRDELEAVAGHRGIILEYPDVKFPNPKYNKFFEGIRKSKEENKKENIVLTQGDNTILKEENA